MIRHSAIVSWERNSGCGIKPNCTWILATSFRHRPSSLHCVDHGFMQNDHKMFGMFQYGEVRDELVGCPNPAPSKIASAINLTKHLSLNLLVLLSTILRCSHGKRIDIMMLPNASTPLLRRVGLRTCQWDIDFKTIRRTALPFGLNCKMSRCIGSFDFVSGGR